jgi:hypothetical protein
MCDSLSTWNGQVGVIHILCNQLMVHGFQNFDA